MNELVSIIIPAYNAENYISATLESVLNQSYKNLEIIVVDDGSKDRTSDTVNAYALNDSRIKYIFTENGGVSAARNIGIENANGQYFTFLDSDDLLTEDCIEQMLLNIKKHDGDILYAKSVNVRSAEDMKAPASTNEIKDVLVGTDFLKKCLEDNPIGWAAWGKLYKTSKFKAIRFVEGQAINEDSFYAFQTAMECPKVICLDSYLHRYLFRTDSASRSKFQEKFLDILYFAKEKTELIKKHYPELYEMTNLVNLNANLSLLSNLCKTYKKKWHVYEKNSIKEVIRLKKYYKDLTGNKKMFLIVRLHFYSFYKLLFHLKSRIR